MGLSVPAIASPAMVRRRRRQNQTSPAPEKRRSPPRLMRYDELPEYLKDNEFIRDHYRAEWPIREALLSTFSLHNESISVWTHVAGFLVFLWLAAAEVVAVETPDILLFSGFEGIPRLITGSLHNSSSQGIPLPSNRELWKIPRWPRMVFLLGSMACLSCSSIFHLLACHSHRLNLFFARLDYLGISLMIVTSFVPPIYYAFLCHPFALAAYLTSIASVGAATSVVLLSPSLSSPRFRPLRASLFLAMGFSGVVPAAHAIAVHWEHRECHVALALEAAMAAAYSAGAAIYVARVPERWRPGRFDLAGHSHQIFHVLVVVGALTHYVATSVLLRWRGGGASCNER